MRSQVVLLACALVLIADGVRAQCGTGSWDPPFNHENGVFPSSTDAVFPGSPPWPVGAWPTPGTYRFNAIHMSLIPKGPHRGKVLVFDYDPTAFVGTVAYQRWAIVDPDPNATPRFQNHFRATSNTSSYAEFMFCSGHAWTQEGELFIAGGVRLVNPPTGIEEGCIQTWIFDPVMPQNAPYSLVGDFVNGNPLHNRLWYPTVLLTHRTVRTGTEVMIVAGGSIIANGNPANNPTWNLYEAFKVLGPVNGPLGPPTRDLPFGAGVPTLPGPQIQGPFIDSFLEYPRMHLLSTGEMFMSAYFAPSARVNHDSAPPTSSTSWDHSVGLPSTNPPSPAERIYGSSFRHPNVGGIQDLIVRLGGRDSGQLSDSMEMCQATTPGAWVAMPPMPTRRDECNAVLLPDASWIVFGGRTQVGTNPPVDNTDALIPEHFLGGNWQDIDLDAAASPRSYHSTAVLLPDGRVFTGGGNSRTWDYQIFTPPYLCPSAAANRPTGVVMNVGLNPTDLSYHLSYGTEYAVSCNPLPLGHYLNKAVLMAPGSDTHHSDMSQRYVELARLYSDDTNPPPTNQIQVKTPPNSKFAPRGYYMLFAMSGSGTPSVAAWVKLE